MQVADPDPYPYLEADFLKGPKLVLHAEHPMHDADPDVSIDAWSCWKTFVFDP